VTTTPTTFARLLLAGSSATLYTVGANAKAVITSVVLANTSASPVAATITLDGVVLVPAMAVPGNGLVTVDVKQELATTKIIAGFAGSAATVAAHIGGVVIT